MSARALVYALVVLLPGISAQVVRADPFLADFVYPHAVSRFDFRSQNQDVWMSYMDVAASKPNGRTIVLLHGKNFCGATWEDAIAALTADGYRVIVPDQVGFCRSAKPKSYQFSFQQLAANTHALLQSLGVEKPIVMGHSMGGMLAMRYALMYPSDTAALVLVNPIGLEDWKAKGVPLATVDALYAQERKTSAESLKAYQRNVYYSGSWRPAYDRWVNMLASMYEGEGGDRVAWSQALTSDMIQAQPVIYEIDQIKVPTLLFVGELDRTALGKNRASPEDAKKLGNYPVLAREAAGRIPEAKLITFNDLGHSPHVEAPDRFNAALVEALDAMMDTIDVR